MILVDEVHKRYQTDHGPGKWVLRDVSFVIQPKVNVGLIGCNGAGKSTLLSLIGGVDTPTRGRIERRCRVRRLTGLRFRCLHFRRTHCGGRCRIQEKNHEGISKIGQPRQFDHGFPSGSNIEGVLYGRHLAARRARALVRRHK